MLVLLFSSLRTSQSDRRDDEIFPVRCVFQSIENVQFHLAFLRSIKFQLVVGQRNLFSQLFDIQPNRFLGNVQWHIVDQLTGRRGLSRVTDISLKMVTLIPPTPPATQVDINIIEQTRFALVHFNARIILLDIVPNCFSKWWQLNSRRQDCTFCQMSSECDATKNGTVNVIRVYPKTNVPWTTLFVRGTSPHQPSLSFLIGKRPAFDGTVQIANLCQQKVQMGDVERRSPVQRWFCSHRQTLKINQLLLILCFCWSAGKTSNRAIPMVGGIHRCNCRDVRIRLISFLLWTNSRSRWRRKRSIGSSTRISTFAWRKRNEKDGVKSFSSSSWIEIESGRMISKAKHFWRWANCPESIWLILQTNWNSSNWSSPMQKVGERDRSIARRQNRFSAGIHEEHFHRRVQQWHNEGAIGGIRKREEKRERVRRIKGRNGRRRDAFQSSCHFSTYEEFRLKSLVCPSLRWTSCRSLPQSGVMPLPLTDWFSSCSWTVSTIDAESNEPLAMICPSLSPLLLPPDRLLCNRWEANDHRAETCSTEHLTRHIQRFNRNAIVQGQCHHLNWRHDRLTVQMKFVSRKLLNARILTSNFIWQSGENAEEIWQSIFLLSSPLKAFPRPKGEGDEHESEPSSRHRQSLLRLNVDLSDVWQWDDNSVEYSSPLN